MNPVGAYAAACLGVAEIWKRLWYPHRSRFEHIPIRPLTGSLQFSTFSYGIGTDQPNPPLRLPVDIESLTMLGLGAGGGATAFTLASVSDLHGRVELVDPDLIRRSNLNRYVFAEASDAFGERQKVKLVEELLAQFPHLAVRTFPEAFGKVGADLDYRWVSAAVHSREARRSIQYETPKVLWDAAAGQDGEFRIWRMILGKTECMWCKHPREAEDPELRKAAQLAQLLGLEEETWLRKLRNNGLFTPDEVGALRLPPDSPAELPAPGERYGDWEAEQCGRLSLPELDDEIPVPFAPVMAGVLIAGEIIKEFQHPNAVLDSYYWNSLIGQFIKSNRPRRRLPRAGCRFCHDPDYLAQYERRWF